MTTELFEQEIAKHKDGANVHTINKTVYYHREAVKQNRPDFAEMLEKMARSCAAKNDWKPLTLRLANYW